MNLIRSIRPVHFSVRHMMLSNVRGEFTKVSGTIKLDAQNPANSAVEVTIDVPRSILAMPSAIRT